MYEYRQGNVDPYWFAIFYAGLETAGALQHPDKFVLEWRISASYSHEVGRCAIGINNKANDNFTYHIHFATYGRVLYVLPQILKESRISFFELWDGIHVGVNSILRLAFSGQGRANQNKGNYCCHFLILLNQSQYSLYIIGIV